ncbi:unnamed protein product [Lactuca saligna]|uniref:Uncharacterized protein n=1 Tax=Lactuca saligna TaxID=75948 RepID=A0AA35ZZT3_LACSI|nr:unnamed protein product [Lactuca saligna]
MWTFLTCWLTFYPFGRAKINVVLLCMLKWAHIVEDNGLGNFSIPNDMPRNQPGSAASRRFQDNLAWSSSYTNMNLDYKMQQMHFARPDHFPPSYPYAPSWEELWREKQVGAGGNGGGGDDYDNEE